MSIATTSALTAAIETFRPDLEALYAKQARRIAEGMLEKFGPTLRGIANSDKYRTYEAWVAPILTSDGYRIDSERRIDDAKVARFAAKQADACIAQWTAKIAEKLGDIDHAKVVNLGAYTFAIIGSRGGRSIRIEQQIVVKSSPRGTVFNQFPARIYLDGKFTPEAKYKAMFN